MADRVVAKQAIEVSLDELNRRTTAATEALAAATLQHEAAVAASTAELARISAQAAGLQVAIEVVDEPPPPIPEPEPPVEPPAPPVKRKLNLHGFTVATNEAPSAFDSLKRLDAGLKKGVKSNVVVTFPGQNDTPYYTKSGFQSGLYRALTAYGAVASVSAPICFRDDEGKFDDVLAGKKDAIHREMAKLLVRDGQAEAIIRLGWEMDLRGSFAYGLQYDWHGKGNAKNFVKYKAAFRRIASVYLEVSPKFIIDWCHFKDPMVRDEGKMVTIDPRQYFPDDKGERLIQCGGVDYYDGDNDITRGTAERLFMRMKGNVPIGVEAWYRLICGELKIPFFSLPEVGIRCWEERVHPNEDNPGFVEALFDWMGTKSNILYWSWFHRATHLIWPQTIVGTKKATGAFIEEFPKWKAKAKA
jgi:hypothetical protein